MENSRMEKWLRSIESGQGELLEAVRNCYRISQLYNNSADTSDNSAGVMNSTILDDNSTTVYGNSINAYDIIAIFNDVFNNMFRQDQQTDVLKNSNLTEIENLDAILDNACDLCPTSSVSQVINAFMPTVPTFAVRETDVSRHNGGTSGAPLKPLRDDSVFKTLLSLRGLRGACAMPPLCRETQSLGQQMLERWA